MHAELCSCRGCCCDLWNPHTSVKATCTFIVSTLPAKCKKKLRSLNAGNFNLFIGEIFFVKQQQQFFLVSCHDFFHCLSLAAGEQYMGLLEHPWIRTVAVFPLNPADSALLTRHKLYLSSRPWRSAGPGPRRWMNDVMWKRRFEHANRDGSDSWRFVGLLNRMRVGMCQRPDRRGPLTQAQVWTWSHTLRSDCMSTGISRHVSIRMYSDSFTTQRIKGRTDCAPTCFIRCASIKSQSIRSCCMIKGPPTATPWRSLHSA